ncbi:septation protein SepH [Cellulomonas sp. NTE-D12]|uniref:septation protein SepH n=1 Tax=Cellulomonas sp. NTE-D12 TaxID=2962632 RepID=UPI00308124A1|nr:hypothetical protein CELD12_19490 [Cellulomonas sp. NTE-D12]
MGELELVGLHEDGEHLVLSGPDGQRFRLRIDEPLRAAVRRDRPQLEQLRSERAGTLSPREIQARIRAGATAQEVADSAGLPVEAVRRYDGPVLAEREYIAEQARSAHVGHENGSPALGDLVTDRLAARGVDVSTLGWDAARDGASPWTVLAHFVVGGEPREARWSFDAASHALVALDDEARWLSETELDEPVGRRHLAAVRDVVFDFRADPAPLGGEDREPVADPVERTAALLDDLRSRRGVRQGLDVEDDEDDGDRFEGFGPQRAFDLGTFEQQVPGAHPVDADPVAEARVLSVTHLHAAGSGDTEDAAGETPPVATVPAPAASPDEPAPAADRPRSRRGRAKVPSWDEIVFGAKPE